MACEVSDFPYGLDAAYARMGTMPHVDVRVRDPPVTSPWSGVDVSLQDILGGRLVTYESLIGPVPPPEHALEPKAVYVQYTGLDPITGEYSEVVVPAHLSLDVCYNPRCWEPQEEEEEVEEEPAETVEEDRRKLRSSIKGDPILLRAKRAPPPDPYFAPHRHETLLNAQAVARPPMGLRKVENSSTISSFLKASGRDKYSRSRLAEVDHILKLTRPPNDRHEERATAAALDGCADTVVANSEADPPDGRGLLPKLTHGRDDLAAQMALHIQNMPRYYKRRPCAGVEDVSWEEPCSSVGEDDDTVKCRRSTLLTGDTRLSVTSGFALETEPSEGLSRQAVAQLCGSSDELRNSRVRSVSCGRRSTARRSVQSPRGANLTQSSLSTVGGSLVKGSSRLRDLDPHLQVPTGVPTMRAHSNWPEGVRRQLARHFYGMSPELILEEEAREEQRELGRTPNDSKETISRDREADDPLTTDSPVVRNSKVAVSASPSTRAKVRRRIERAFAVGADASGEVPHRLEIRVRNVSRPQRVVVCRQTRKRGPEAACRPTLR